MEDFKIRLMEGDGFSPIFLQIKNSLEYAIGYGQLSPGTRLPSIREMAKHLDVTPNTVARAYQELQSDGLLESRKGQGTFVPDLIEHKTDPKTSINVLTSILNPAIESARAIGFSSKEIITVTGELLREKKLKVWFATVYSSYLENWIRKLEHGFKGVGVQVIGITIDELKTMVKERPSDLKPIRNVITLTTNYAKVRKLLCNHNVMVSALLVEPTPATHKVLSELPSSGDIGMICGDIYINSFLELLSTHIDPNRVRHVLPYRDKAMKALFQETTVILYTSPHIETVKRYAKSTTRLIELEFDTNKAHLKQLRIMFKKQVQALKNNVISE